MPIRRYKRTNRMIQYFYLTLEGNRKLVEKYRYIAEKMDIHRHTKRKREKEKLRVGPAGRGIRYRYWHTNQARRWLLG